MTESFESAFVHRLDLGLYSHPKEFWGNRARTHVNFNGIIPSTGKKFPQRRSNPRRCIKSDSLPNTLPTELFRPLSEVSQPNTLPTELFRPLSEVSQPNTLPTELFRPLSEVSQPNTLPTELFRPLSEDSKPNTLPTSYSGP